MASVPHSMSMAKSVRKKEKKERERRHFEKEKNEPSCYNNKMMNSIWGQYNKYSVHNLKALQDHNEIAYSTMDERENQFYDSENSEQKINRDRFSMILKMINSQPKATQAQTKSLLMQMIKNYRTDLENGNSLGQQFGQEQNFDSSPDLNDPNMGSLLQKLKDCAINSNALKH